MTIFVSLADLKAVRGSAYTPKMWNASSLHLFISLFVNTA